MESTLIDGKSHGQLPGNGRQGDAFPSLQRQKAGQKNFETVC